MGRCGLKGQVIQEAAQSDSAAKEGPHLLCPLSLDNSFKFLLRSQEKQRKEEAKEASLGRLILEPYTLTMSRVCVLGLPKQRFLSTSDPTLPRCSLRSPECTVKEVDFKGGRVGVQSPGHCPLPQGPNYHLY